LTFPLRRRKLRRHACSPPRHPPRSGFRPPHAPRDLLAEIAALRQQLAIYKRTVPRPKIRAADRMLWVTLLRLWSGWRDALVIVKPETVIAWQRSAFRR
jgi:hypothetical protein